MSDRQNPAGHRDPSRMELTLEQSLEVIAQLAATPWPPKEKPMDDMAAAHDRDYRRKRLYDDARQALQAVLEDEDARRRLGGQTIFEGYALALCDEFEKQSDHVVAVWN